MHGEEERGDPAGVIGVGASAGGVEALVRLVRGLPDRLPWAVCVVLHVPATGRSLLAPILARETQLEVGVAEDGEAVRAGHVYIAPADRHLTVHDGRLRLERGPKENGVRPAVDPMLRSLAAGYGERAIAVVLSGALGDGSNGVLAVRRAGGTVIVQDPADATVQSMPESAVRAVGEPDAVLPAGEIGPELARRAGVRHDVPAMTAAADAMERAGLIRGARGTRGDRPDALDLRAEVAE